MLFNSGEFLLFFPIVTAMYFLLPKKLKNFWLLLSSYYFYMCWNAKYALLMLFSTVVTFLSGIVLERIKKSTLEEKKKTVRKKLAVAASLLLNLTVLFFFKYFNFSLDILQKVFALVRINLEVPHFDIILPVGISFYTFQALSYTMDVYRDDIYAEKNFFEYALFVSFFPQLVAGPIERSKNLLKQLAVPKKFDFEKAREGFLLMLWGFFLKLVLADRLAVFVDTVYGSYMEYGGWYLVVATVFFAFQIYCDFYGYSVIAMGAAKILGIDLMENFVAPYYAQSVTEFWRRWHISLSSWFRDYLYFPLGGSKKGKVRKQLNRMVVFLTSGLWHGAQISYIVWGALNGLFQVVGDGLKPVREKIIKILQLNQNSTGHKVLRIVCTFTLICFTWIFFRADGMQQAIAIVNQMFIVKNPWILMDGSLYACGLDRQNFQLAIVGVIVLLVADYFKYKGIKIHQEIISQDYWVRWLVIVGSILVILVLGLWGPAYDASSFVYFQF
jgi:D-alanyl-lipoteichoic acid acyltransferase DltB (MBOAT superfamily)